MARMRLIWNAMVLGALALESSGPVHAVTQSESIPAEHEPIASVTSTSAAKARTDLQIRRIKNLIVTGVARDESSLDKLKDLQRSLRGER